MKSKKLLILSISLIGISFTLCILSLGYLYLKNKESDKHNPFVAIKEESYNIKNQTIERELVINKVSQDEDTLDNILSEQKINELIKESREKKELSVSLTYSEYNDENPKECELNIYDSQKYSKCKEDEWYSDDLMKIEDLINNQQATSKFVNYENYFTSRKNIYNILVQIYDKNQWKETSQDNQTIYESSQVDTVQKVLSLSSIDDLLSGSKQQVDENSITASVKIVTTNKQINEIEFQISYLLEEKDHNFNKQKNKVSITSKSKFNNINSTDLQIDIDEIKAKLDPVIKLIESSKSHKGIENLTITANSNFINSYSSSGKQTFYETEDHFSLTEIHHINIIDELAVVEYNSNLTYDKGGYYQYKENKVGTVYRYQDICLTRSDDFEDCNQIYYVSLNPFWYDWSYFNQILTVLNEPGTIERSSIKYNGNELIGNENFYVFEIDANLFDYLSLKRMNIYNSTTEGTVKIWLKESTNQIYKIHISFTEKYNESGGSGEGKYDYDVRTTHDTTFTITDINNTEISFPDEIKEEIKKDVDYY